MAFGNMTGSLQSTSKYYNKKTSQEVFFIGGMIIELKAQ